MVPPAICYCYSVSTIRLGLAQTGLGYWLELRLAKIHFFVGIVNRSEPAQLILGLGLDQIFHAFGYLDLSSTMIYAQSADTVPDAQACLDASYKANSTVVAVPKISEAREYGFLYWFWPEKAVYVGATLQSGMMYQWLVLHRAKTVELLPYSLQFKPRRLNFFRYPKFRNYSKI